VCSLAVALFPPTEVQGAKCKIFLMFGHFWSPQFAVKCFPTFNVNCFVSVHLVFSF